MKRSPSAAYPIPFVNVMIGTSYRLEILTRTIRLVLEWMHDYRGKGLWSILAYRVSLAGIRHARRNAALTRETFERIYTRALPGCRMDATVFSGLAVWDEMESRQPDQPRRS